MADDGGGVSLAAVGLIAGGMVLAYSAVNDPVGGPIGVLRDIAAGRTPTPGVQTITKPVGPVGSVEGFGPATGGGSGSGGFIGPVQPGSGTRAKVIEVARQYMGVPYVWGGASKKGVDCSGLVLVAYRDGAGIKLPHRATLQAARGTRIPRDQVRPADLVAWGVPGNYPHIALAVDQENCIVASTFGTRVSIKKIDVKAVPGYGYPSIIKILP